MSLGFSQEAASRYVARLSTGSTLQQNRARTNASTRGCDRLHASVNSTQRKRSVAAPPLVHTHVERQRRIAFWTGRGPGAAGAGSRSWTTSPMSKSWVDLCM